MRPDIAIEVMPRRIAAPFMAAAIRRANNKDLRHLKAILERE